MRASARRNIRLLTWFNFCDDFRVYNAVAVIYFAQITHSYALAALVFSLAKISSAVFEIPTGVLSDLVQRKFTLVLGQVSSTIAVLCYALGGSFAMLAAGAIFEGLAFSFFSGNNDAFLYDTLKEEGDELQFALWQARVSSMFQFALAASALVATVVRWVPFSALFWTSLLPKFLGLGLCLFLTEPRRAFVIDTNIYRHLRDSIGGILRVRRLRLLTAAYIIAFGIGETKFLLLPGFYALFWPPWALGLARLLSHLLAGAGFRAGGWIIRRFGEARVLLSALPFSMAMNLSALAVANVASPVFYSFSSLPFGPANVAQSSLMQKAFSDHQRATMASVGAFGGNLLFALAMFALGIMADRVGLRYALLAAEILSIPAVILYWRTFGAKEAT